MKERLRRTVVKYLVVLGVGIAYLVFVLCTGIGIPCPIYTVSGFKCPACGISRMLVSLVRFDLESAFGHNPFLMVTGPLILFCLIYSDYLYIKRGDRSAGWLTVLMWIIVAALLIFGVLRNVI